MRRQKQLSRRFRIQPKLKPQKTNKHAFISIEFYSKNSAEIFVYRVSKGGDDGGGTLSWTDFKRKNSEDPIAIGLMPINLWKMSRPIPSLETLPLQWHFPQHFFERYPLFLPLFFELVPALLPALFAHEQLFDLNNFDTHSQ